MHEVLELARIFSSVRQSVIGLDSSNQTIVFVNVAAKSVLGFDPTGKSAKEIMAFDILSEDASEYMCGTTIFGRRASVSVVKVPHLILLFVDFLSDGKPSLNITRQMMSSLRNSAMGLKMSADRFFSNQENAELSDEKHISVFYHYYYSLLRTLINIDSADQIGRGELPFSCVPTDLVKLCSELTGTVTLLCGETGVKIKFASNEQQLIAAVDPQRIEQLLLNLFANSLQHTSAGNSITLSLARVGNRIVISLDDDGEGIPQDIMPDIFKIPENENETVLKPSGIGLGLFISYGIAQLHNGVLLVESREGKGTRVRLMLPINTDPSSKFNSPEAPYHHSGTPDMLIGLADVMPSSNYGLKYED